MRKYPKPGQTERRLIRQPAPPYVHGSIRNLSAVRNRRASRFLCFCRYRKPRARCSEPPRAPGHCPWSWASLTSTDTQAARGPRPVAQVSVASPAAALSPGEENTVPARGRKPATRAARYGSPRAVQESQPKGRRPGKNAVCAQRRHLHGTRLTRARATHATNAGLDVDFNLFLGPPCPGASLGAPACRARGTRRARSPHTQTARGPSTACREAGGFAADDGWCAFASGKVLKPWVGGAGATPRGDPAPNPQQPNSHPATDEPDMRSGGHGDQLLGGNLQALCSRPHSPVSTRSLI